VGYDEVRGNPPQQSKNLEWRPSATTASSQV